MESSSSFIQENIKKVLNSNMFVSPDIPEKKLNNAMALLMEQQTLINAILLNRR